MKKYSVPVASAVLLLVIFVAAILAWLAQHQLFMRIQQQQLDQYAHLVAITAVNHRANSGDQRQLQALLEHAPIPVDAIQLIDASKKILLSVGNHSQIPTELTSDFRQADGRWRLVMPAPAAAQLIVIQGSWPTPQLVFPFLPWLIISLSFAALSMWGWGRYQTIVRVAARLPEHGSEIPRALLPIFHELTNLQQQCKQQELQHQQQLQSLISGQQDTAQELQQAYRQRDLQQEQFQLLNHSLYFWQQLAAHAKHMSEAELQYRVSVIKAHDELKAHRYQGIASMTHAPYWLLSAHVQWLSLIPAGVRVIYDEDPQAYQYQLHLDQTALTLLMSILLKQCAATLGTGDIVVSYRLAESPQRLLKIQLRYEGSNLPNNWQPGVQSANQMNWQELEPMTLHALLRHLGAEYRVESLEGLGTHIELRCPISLQKENTAKPFHSIGFCASDAFNYQLYRQSLLALGEQVIAANSLSELSKELKSRLVDLLIIQLPDDLVVDPALVSELVSLDARHPMLCFAHPHLAARLSSECQIKFLSRPMMLEQIQRSLAEQPEIRSQQLLVVDDNLTNLSFVRTVLAGQGLSIDIAMTGAEAIKMATHSRYQLILMDIQLPDLPGTEVTKRIRQLRHHQQTTILAFTAHAMQDEMVSFKLAGMDDVLIKPLDAKKIAHILTRIRVGAES